MALEVANNGTTVSQLASKSGVHPTQISEWMATLITEGGSLFERRPASSVSFSSVGRFQVAKQHENAAKIADWVKFNAAFLAKVAGSSYRIDAQSLGTERHE